MEQYHSSLNWTRPNTPLTETNPDGQHTFFLPEVTPSTPNLTTPAHHRLPLSFQNQTQNSFTFGTPVPSKRPRAPTISSQIRDENISPEHFPSNIAGKRSKRTRSPTLVRATPLSRSIPSLTEAIPPSPSPGSSNRRSPRSNVEKLDCILVCILEQGWTLGMFLVCLFVLLDQHGQPILRSRRHATMVSSFLAGRTTHTPAHILDAWMKSPDGRIERDSPDRHLLYSTTVPFTEIAPVRGALTSFASQLVAKELVREAQSAVKGSSGLHASVNSKIDVKKIHWADIGAATVPHVAGILRKHQPLTWHLVGNIAMRKPRIREGVLVPVRKTRPAEGVITHAISSLNFCRTDRANLLPLARGFLYFGSSAPVDLMSYNSRIGNMTSYYTVYNSFKGLSEQESVITEAHGADPETVGFLVFDNVQNYARVHDPRIGRENTMNVGMAAIYVEAVGIKPEVLDLDDKRARIAENKRQDVTVDDFLRLVDQKHLELVRRLQWLEVLTRCIPELSHLAADVSLRYRTVGAKLQLPIHKSVIHPLASSGKKQTIVTEFKDGLLDFLSQCGQKANKFLRRLFLGGGDGLTFFELLQLKAYLQFHPDEFTSLEVIEPSLQIWHLKWTDLIRIFNTHWGKLSGKHTNPASLGHSAAKIGRGAPSDMKKVEFYAGSQLLYLVLDSRMIDCWANLIGTEDIYEHFVQQKIQNKIPSTLEDLLPMANQLHRAYSSFHGRDRALYDSGETSIWAKTVPAGTPWTPVPVEDSSLDKKKKKRKSKKPPKVPKKPAKKPEDAIPKPPFKGDHVLAQSINFIIDGMNSREAAYAVAEGDVGRVYETIKMMLFTFAGSPHTNYMGYALETICNLELESSPGLKDALLRCLLVNVSGLPGHFAEGDFVQEFFNRLLEDIVQHKSAQFDDTFIRNIVSRNLHHIAALKMAWREGVGLQKKSGKHAPGHTKPEMRTLVASNRLEQLHKRRTGRVIDDRDTDDFGRGLIRLRNGALESWKNKTLRSRGVSTKYSQSEVPSTVPVGNEGTSHGVEGFKENGNDKGNEDDTNSESDSDGSDSDSDVELVGDLARSCATSGSMSFRDGQFVIDERDMLCGEGDDGDDAFGMSSREEPEGPSANEYADYEEEEIDSDE